MKIIAVIPARFGSTRFPGKPLALIKNKPMIEWVIQGARTSKFVDHLIVATDDHRISEAVKKLGVEVIMTSSECKTGTDRVYQALKNKDFDVVINIQGDEPEISSEFIDPLAQAFLKNPNLDMATLSHPISEIDVTNLNAVKVIKNINQEAIYFSRLAIPFSRLAFSHLSSTCEKHIGIYGFSRNFLKTFCETEPCQIELSENLEQLRALHLGAKIKVISVNQSIQGIDTPEDLERLNNMTNNEKK